LKLSDLGKPLNLILFVPMEDYSLSTLDELEADAIHLLRELTAEQEDAPVVEAGSEGSPVLRKLAEKAFAPQAARLHIGMARPAPAAEIQDLWGLINARPGVPRVAPLSHWTGEDLRGYLSPERARRERVPGEPHGADLLRLVVAGSPGVGKSKVVDWLTDEAAQASGAWRHFASGRRRFMAFDPPEQAQLESQLAGGASRAQLALLVLDAAKGLDSQAKRHALVCGLLGIPRIVVAVNKLDLAADAQGRFEAIREEFEVFAARLGFKSITFVPVNGERGDNIARRSERMPWYEGPSLRETLQEVYIGGDRNLVDLRFMVQGRVGEGPGAWFPGRVDSGVVKVGDEVLVLPSHRRTRVRAIALGERRLDYAYAPLSVSLALEDEIDAGRGAMIVHPRNMPRGVRSLESMVLWMSPETLRPGQVYLLKHGTKWVRASCAEVIYRLDPETLHRASGHALGLNDIGRASFTLFEERFVDPYTKNRSTGGFLVVDPQSGATAGAGMIVDRDTEPARVERSQAVKRIVIPHASKVTDVERSAILGQRSVTVWLTGLSGSGKSTIATELEKRLIELGRASYMLDGDNIRTGINRDLGFGPDDRRENIRRIAEVARLMNDAGLIAVTAFISPYREDREMARQIIGPQRFVEVYLGASLEVCEQRDPKGLYKKARKGEIPEFTGISAPYEAPEHPAMMLDTGALTLEQCVEQLLDRLLDRTAVTAR
jgi:bifunctional enzyme CysN/CysC